MDPKAIASIRYFMRETGEGFHALLGRVAKAELARVAEEEKPAPVTAKLQRPRQRLITANVVKRKSEGLTCLES
jgi:hypothetical protein